MALLAAQERTTMEDIIRAAIEREIARRQKRDLSPPRGRKASAAA